MKFSSAEDKVLENINGGQSMQDPSSITLLIMKPQIRVWCNSKSKHEYMRNVLGFARIMKGRVVDINRHHLGRITKTWIGGV